jgi:large subunit ribosomal protein L13
MAKNLTLYRNLRIYAQIAMTDFIKKNEIKNDWYIIDAENLVVGRLAAFISKVLRGKNKTQYTPSMDHGDFIVITNIEKIKFTGNKFTKKKYYRHSGYPGGIKERTPNILLSKKPEEILKLAVKRMLPGGPLAKKQLTKLKIYKGKSHPHESQNPTIIDFGKLNQKNLRTAS